MIQTNTLADPARRAHAYRMSAARYLAGCTAEQRERLYSRLYFRAVRGDHFGADLQTLRVSGRVQLATAIDTYLAAY